MQTYRVKYKENCVYKDKVSLTVYDILAKFIWYSHVFYVPLKRDKLFIPANNSGWKWILNETSIGLTSSGLKLLGNDETKSYLAVHYENQDPAPYPLTLNISLPEFLGNYLAIEIEDEGCRVKSLLHSPTEKLFVDNLHISFIEVTNKLIEFSINEDNVN